MAATASGWVSVRVRSSPAETSFVMRTWARRGSDDPSSVQARMIRIPTSSLMVRLGSSRASIACENTIGKKH
jgi:hypothetical protein